jgi:hypothetical protein
VREAARIGCWIVQNPRSNANNRVGYPRGLQASGRVAVGTDGFVSDMRAEAAALADEAERHGEPRDVAVERLSAGQILASEFFGPTADTCEMTAEGPVATLTIAGRIVVREGALVTGDLDEIRRSAAEAAPRVWRRMAELT